MSAKKRSETEGAGAFGRLEEVAKLPTKMRASSAPSDLGRALRTVYDDTLREAVPDDFVNLIGKLS